MRSYQQNGTHKPLEPGAEVIAKSAGMSPERVAALNEIEGALSDGTFLMKDGRILTKEQVAKLGTT